MPGTGSPRPMRLWVFLILSETRGRQQVYLTCWVLEAELDEARCRNRALSPPVRCTISSFRRLVIGRD